AGRSAIESAILAAQSRRPAFHAAVPAAQSRRPAFHAAVPAAQSRRPAFHAAVPAAQSRRPAFHAAVPPAQSRRPAFHASMIIAIYSSTAGIAQTSQPVYDETGYTRDRRSGHVCLMIPLTRRRLDVWQHYVAWEVFRLGCQ